MFLLHLWLLKRNVYPRLRRTVPCSHEYALQAWCLFLEGTRAQTWPISCDAPVDHYLYLSSRTALAVDDRGRTRRFPVSRKKKGVVLLTGASRSTSESSIAGNTFFRRECLRDEIQTRNTREFTAQQQRVRLIIETRNITELASYFIPIISMNLRCNWNA